MSATSITILRETVVLHKIRPTVLLIWLARVPITANQSVINAYTAYFVSLWGTRLQSTAISRILSVQFKLNVHSTQQQMGNKK